MKYFVDLYKTLESSKSAKEHLAALQFYLSIAPDEDKLTMIALLLDQKPSSVISAKKLKEIALQYAGIDSWLYDESYQHVGNQIETISLILPKTKIKGTESLSYWISEIRGLKKVSTTVLHERIKGAWSSLGIYEKYVFNKLITGSLKINIARQILIMALAAHTALSKYIIAIRLSRAWTPDTQNFRSLLFEENKGDKRGVPYPFHIPEHFDKSTNEDMGDLIDWQVENLWDGLRVQLIKREGTLYVWSLAGDLLTDKFLELQGLIQIVADGFVIDGIILPIRDGKFLSKDLLTKRLSKKKVNLKLIEENQSILIAYDLLDFDGQDVRDKSLIERQNLLAELITEINKENKEIPIVISEALSFSDWSALGEAIKAHKKMGIKGMILKNKESSYLEQNEMPWFKWKPESYKIDAILMYAVGSSGGRSSRFIEYTFGVWNGDALVSIAKCFGGLSKEEHEEIRLFILANTTEKHGPVRVLSPGLVFKLSFEDIIESQRHKSGIKLEKVQILNWEKGLKPQEASDLKDLKTILKQKHIT